jgi:glycine cleavage system regulatory protein
MLTTFRFGSNEKHIREALTAAFKRRGVDLAQFDASIRSIMVAAAFSTGVEEQVEAFIRLARVAEQFDLPDDLRRELAVKAYRSYGERAFLLPRAPS